MLSPNQILQERYRMVRKLGQGGMGIVYEAIDQRVNCLVAIKETTASGHAEARAAFQREAGLLANLRHQSLPKVMDYFSENESDFLVMEFIPGYDLAELLELRGSAFPQSQVVRWAISLLLVLEYLHSQNPPILHRDIKPSNLKLTKQGEIFLLDFGLAKGSAGQMPTHLYSRSVAGHTPLYASLEQILGQGSDARSDLYSLGATLYHLLSGSPPVPAPQRFQAIEDEQPDPLQPITRLNAQTSPNVAAVVHKALEITRKQRPESALVMRRELQVAQEEDERSSAAEEFKRVEERVQRSRDKTVENVEPVAHKPSGKTTEKLNKPVAQSPPLPPAKMATPHPSSKTTPAAAQPKEFLFLSDQTLPAEAQDIPRKSKKVIWSVAGGLLGLIVVAVVVVVILLSTNTGWRDTESNRAIDRGNQIAARVNGKAIELKEVEQAVKQQFIGRDATLSTDQLLRARLSTLQTLIQREVLYQQAEREQLLPTDQQVEEKISKEQYNSRMTANNFEIQIRERGMTDETFKEKIKKDLAISRLIEKRQGLINISDREVEEFYRANTTSFFRQRSVELAVIAVDPAVNSLPGFAFDAKSNDDVKFKIDWIQRELAAGANFETLAKGLSEDAESATKGGVLSPLTEKELTDKGFPSDLISDFFKSMNTGTITKPIQGLSGKMAIFKLLRVFHEPEQLTLDRPGVRQEITLELVRQRGEVVRASLLETTLNGAKIVNYLAERLG